MKNWFDVIKELKCVRIFEFKTVCGSRHLPLSDESSWDGAAAEKRMRAKATSNDTINWSVYRKGFVYVDPNNKENLGGYKLPFADVIDGQLKAVWGGVNAAYGALRGSRGGVNMSSSDKSKCMSFLESYYKLFDKPIPGKE